MRRLTIAIDCDDVLVPSTKFIVDEYNRLYNTQVTYGRAHEPRNEQWASTREETESRIHNIQLSNSYGLIKPFTEAIEAVGRLAKYNSLHMVTARDEKILDVTKSMIDAYFPDAFETLEHVGLRATKGDVCKALGADILIDDNLKHLINAHEHGIAGLIWFGDYAWNSEESLPPGVLRCTNWKELEKEINRNAEQ